MFTFNTDNMVQQKFPFPAPIMDYIFKNLTAAQLLKLYKTCKFFYAKYRLNIIEDFAICGNKDEESIVGNSLAIWQQNPAWLQLNDLWISKSFIYCKYFEEDQPFELEYEKFSRLTYTTLCMHGVKFTARDYDFLVKPTTIQHLIIDGAIFNPDSDLDLSVEECLEKAPHVSTVDFSCDDPSPNISPIDIKRLIAFERETKLTSLHLCDVSKILDPLLVIEFFKKHAVPEIDYYFGFDEDDDEYDAENAKAFYNTIDEGIRAWKLTLAVPPAITSSFMDLTGKTVFITGASDGIGRATTILFRQLGASVIAVARNKFRLKTLIDECQNFKNDGFLHTVYTPFIYHETIDQLFKRINCKFGLKFDVLVNNADIYGWSGVPQFERERRFCLNESTIVGSHRNLIKEAKTYLIEGKGCVINVPYSDELITRSQDTSFIAEAKQQIKNIEAELLSSGVRINIVNPGANVTTLPRRHDMTNIEYKKLLENSKKTHEQQAANSIAFLASDAAKLINKTTMNVNPMNLN